MVDVLVAPRAFVSHAHAEKTVGEQAKRILEALGLDVFLAHEDVKVSEEWRHRLLDELRTCNVFVPIFSNSFLGSEWGGQEVGFISSRPEVLTIPLSIDGTTPSGFLSHIQGRHIPADGLTKGTILEPLARRFPRHILPDQIRIAGEAGSFRYAEETMAPLVPLFALFSPNEAQAFAEACAKNGQVWSAFLCRTKYLPAFLQQLGSNIDAGTFRKLQFQITHDRWYDSEAQPE